MLEATSSDVSSSDWTEIWSRFGKDVLASKGYDFSQQPKLLGICFARSLRNSNADDVSKVVLDMQVAMTSSASNVHASSKQALSECLLPVVSCSSCDVDKLEDALKLADDEKANALIQSCFTVPGGKQLKKDARAMLEKRKEALAIAGRLDSLNNRAKQIFIDNAEKPDHAVKIFANLLIAANIIDALMFCR